VRGSSCAWDIRLISADALGKLVEMKEDAEGPEIAQRIRSLLVPSYFPAQKSSASSTISLARK
jgi:hypothetical protein